MLICRLKTRICGGRDGPDDILQRTAHSVAGLSTSTGPCSSVRGIHTSMAFLGTVGKRYCNNFMQIEHHTFMCQEVKMKK